MDYYGVRYDLAFLRSLDWIDASGAEPGGTIHLQLPEMGLDGPALVESISACPPIEPDDGTGRMIVTGTMRHLAGNVLDLHITGLDEPLGVTDTHPIWSETRHSFVTAGQLQPGEQLRSETGTVSQVTRITPRRGPPQLTYNLEVNAEHVYHVAATGLLVHNSCDDTIRLFHGTDAASQADILTGGIKPVGLDDGIFHVTDKLEDAAKWGDEVVELNVPSGVVHDLFQKGDITGIPHIPGGYGIKPSAFELLNPFLKQ